MRRYNLSEVQELMWDHEHVRDIGIVAHIDHGKTTLTDSLVAASGIISMEHAGEQLFTDYMDLEQERGITIQTAAVSLAHQYEDEEYIINLLDTPGHVDFSGDVTRALRAIDGVIVVVDAVEGVMVQTETVIRQSIREHARPVLFINKVDRLIDELKLSPEEMEEKFVKIITKFNKLLRKYAPDDLADRWKVSVENGSVAFGSAIEKWAVSATQMKKKGITFGDIISAHENDEVEDLAEKSPLFEVVLDMVVGHLPNPEKAQEERIPKIWRGDIDSPIGQAMLNCDPDGPVCMMITDIIVDEQAGVVSTGRVFSGTLEKGKEVKLIGAKREKSIQQVGVYMGPDRVMVDKAPAGNIAAIIGMKDSIVGDTIIEAGSEGTSFEELQYVSEPVVTVAVEPKDYKDLPQLIDELKKISREDPNVQIKIDEETGEYLISGMGELHLQVVQHQLEESGLEIETSEPLVVYRESVKGKGGPVEGKSPNKHNRFKISIEPLEPEVIEALDNGEITPKQDQKERAKKLRELGWDTKLARSVLDVEGQNIFADATKGIQYMREIEDYAADAFKEAVNEGPLMQEPVRGAKVLITDAKLHEDAIHRGPAQVIPAVRKAIHAAMLLSEPTVLEPLLKVEIRVPQEFLGGATQVVQGRRGQIRSIESEEELAIVDSSVPVAESFGLSADLRSSTEGRALWGSEFEKFDEVPQSLQGEAIKETRERKGLKPKPPSPQELVE
ncbi:MAG: elongation factor EF-2 [Hadesarchaea archaeon]|nr:elongation factor EF-2 [Hadesarchaea archaeon]